MKAPNQVLRCPQCGEKGKPVKPITLRSLLREDLRDHISEADERAWRFCETPECAVVYFDQSGDRVFEKRDLTVRLGIKEVKAPRPICYCFNHTVEEIEEEVARTGTTTVLEDIKTRMKEACWCETTSPMGSCCLGTVTRFIKAAQADASSEPEAGPVEEEDCCAAHESTAPQPEPANPEKRRFGILATGGAVLSAALSSACCWLPLLLVAFGASAAGIAGFFEAWRPWFLGGAVLLLGAGFYYTYFRKERCAPGATCATPNPRRRSFNRAMLWVAAVFVAAFALFPNYLGALIRSAATAGTIEEMAAKDNAVVLQIEGMTCESCATSLENSLSSVPGVAAVKVDYEGSRAVVLPNADEDSIRAASVRVIEKNGYSVPEDIAARN